MNESKNNTLAVILIVLVIILIASLVIIFRNNNVLNEQQVSAGLTNEMTKNEETNIENESEKNTIVENTTIKNESATSSKVETSKNTELTNTEKTKVEQYVNIICNRSKYYRLPEFNDINNANKIWLYSHINREKYLTEATENEIKNDLKELFGNNLIIDVNKDIEENKNDNVVNMPGFNKQTGKYDLPSYGKDYLILYAIDTIKKEKDYYIVNVVEYSIQKDMEKNPDEDYNICAYSKNSNSKYNKIFEKSNKTDEEIVNSVLKQKNKFQNYNLIIENINGNFNVKEIKNINK